MILCCMATHGSVAIAILWENVQHIQRQLILFGILGILLSASAFLLRHIFTCQPHKYKAVFINLKIIHITVIVISLILLISLFLSIVLSLLQYGSLAQWVCHAIWLPIILIKQLPNLLAPRVNFWPRMVAKVFKVTNEDTIGLSRPLGKYSPGLFHRKCLAPHSARLCYQSALIIYLSILRINYIFDNNIAILLAQMHIAIGFSLLRCIESTFLLFDIIWRDLFRFHGHARDQWDADFDFSTPHRII